MKHINFCHGISTNKLLTETLTIFINTCTAYLFGSVRFFVNMNSTYNCGSCRWYFSKMPSDRISIMLCSYVTPQTYQSHLKRPRRRQGRFQCLSAAEFSWPLPVKWQVRGLHGSLHTDHLHGTKGYASHGPVILSPIVHLNDLPIIWCTHRHPCPFVKQLVYFNCSALGQINSTMLSKYITFQIIQQLNTKRPDLISVHQWYLCWWY